MDLLILRHAQAQDLAPGADDAQRSLTLHGQAQAQKIAHWLDQHAPKPLTIFCSPAKRTVQTAEALNRPFELSPALSTQGNLETHLSLIQSHPAAHALLLIGHQPTLGELAAFLMTQDPNAYWDIKKAALWWFTLKQHPFQAGTIINLKTVISPKLL